MERRDLLITGYAKLPQGITATELYAIMAVGLVLDRNTGVIIDADCTLATRVARKYVKNLLLGKCLSDVEEIETLFNTHYYGSARKALLSAVRSCAEKYHQICSGAEVNLTE